MASKEDDNKLLLNSSIINELQVNIISVYKRLECVLNNRSESFTNKIESLIEVWKQVSQCRLTEHKQYVVHLMDWLKLHTLNIVLTGDWKKLKDTYEERLLKEVKHCEMLLLHSNNIFSLRCRKLAEVIKDPWGSTVLNRLLNTAEVDIGPDEIEFFGMETGYLISTRLRKLCESHCEDLALNLVTAFMRCHELSEVQHFTLNATEDQRRFILDVYIALLYKYKKTPLIVSTLKSLTLVEGLDLLKRFAHKRVNISKIWRHSSRIAHLAAQVYITAAVMKLPKESEHVLEGLLDTWLFLNEGDDNWLTLTTAVRRIIQAADSAIHMYTFCKAFYKKFGSTMKTFIIELYIRALTTDMNDLERQKNEDDAEKVAETSERLACGFLRLADVLNEHLKVSRECVLTSFSLKPSESTLERIVSLAQSSGYQVLDTGQSWKCKLHPPIDSSDEVCFTCDQCGEFMTQLELKSPLNTNTALSEALTEEQLGLSPQLCDDLVVVLSSPRYQLFSWLVQWKDLHRLCVLYLNDPERTKNIVTELKFVDIDYSMFAGVKREPEDEEVNGIERGYEHYLEDLYPEQNISSDETCDQETTVNNDNVPDTFQLLPPPVPKSDPKVLKSLRQFRPSLKRSNSKMNQKDCVIPPKVFVTSVPSDLPLPCTVYGPRGEVRTLTKVPGIEAKENTRIPCFSYERNSRNSNSWHLYQSSSNSPNYVQDARYGNTPPACTCLPVTGNTSPKDVALNLSMKDSSPAPMDLSKSTRNVEEIHNKLDKMQAVDYLRKKNALTNSPLPLSCKPVQHTYTNENSNPNNGELAEETTSSVFQLNLDNNNLVNSNSDIEMYDSNLSISETSLNNIQESEKIGDYVTDSVIAIESSPENSQQDSVLASNETDIKENGNICSVTELPAQHSELTQNKCVNTSTDTKFVKSPDNQSHIQKVSLECDFKKSIVNHKVQSMEKEVSYINIRKDDSNMTDVPDYNEHDIPDSNEHNMPNSNDHNVSEYYEHDGAPDIYEYDMSEYHVLDVSYNEDDLPEYNEPDYCAGSSDSLETWYEAKTDNVDSDNSEAPEDDSEGDCDYGCEEVSEGDYDYRCEDISEGYYNYRCPAISAGDYDYDYGYEDRRLRTVPIFNIRNSYFPIDLEFALPTKYNIFFISEYEKIPRLKNSSKNMSPSASSGADDKENHCNTTSLHDTKPLPKSGVNFDISSMRNSEDDKDDDDVSVESHEESHLGSSDTITTDSNNVPTNAVSVIESDEESYSNFCRNISTDSDYVPSETVESDEESHPESSPTIATDSNYIPTKSASVIESDEESDPDSARTIATDSNDIPTKTASVIESDEEGGPDSCRTIATDSNYAPTESESVVESDEESHPDSSRTIATDSNYVPTETEEDDELSPPTDSNRCLETISPSIDEEQSNGSWAMTPRSPEVQEDESVELKLASSVTEQKEPSDDFDVMCSSPAIEHNEQSNDFDTMCSAEENNEDATKEICSVRGNFEMNAMEQSKVEIVVKEREEDVVKEKAEIVLNHVNCFSQEALAIPDTNDNVNIIEETTPFCNKINKGTICAPSIVVTDDGSKSNENKIPNRGDICFLKGITLPFDNKIQDFEDDINIKALGEDIQSFKIRITKYSNTKLCDLSVQMNNGDDCEPMSEDITENMTCDIIDPKNERRVFTNRRKSKKLVNSSNKSLLPVQEGIKSISISPPCKTKIIEQSKNELADLVKKYKLKELRVVLNRLTGPDNSNKKDCIKYDELPVHKQKSKSGPKKLIKKSENMTKEQSKAKTRIRKTKSELKPWPLQDISPKVNRFKDEKSIVVKQDKCSADCKTDLNAMNPCVVLKRLEFDKDKKKSTNSVLAQIPGLNDLQMIRPSSVDRIVQVVQVPGARSATNVPIPNTQTSTQVTPHIQRIGQPRTEKPVSSDSETAVASTTAASSTSSTSTTTESPTLINILSQQIIRPANQNNCVNLKPRTSPLINILSQQIIKPASTVSSTKVTSSSGTTDAQVNSIPRVISGGDQIISQLINQVRTPAPTLKTLVSAPGSEQNRILQFICKSSDGKLIPVTSFTSNKVVKVSMTQTVNTSVAGTGGAEENNSKAAQNTFKAKSETTEGLDMLPKFQHAFGKPAYQNSVESGESTGSNNETINTDVEKPSNVKNQPKNSSASLNVQPVQGGVIYTRQVPVGQTINLIPPGRGQVFRIATSNSEQLSLVKDSVIQGKMSALLAAALQGKQRTLENNEVDINSEDDSQASTRVTLTTRQPLVQNARIVKPVLQIPSNVIRSAPQSNLSSTTLEQLREFDMVYKQVKERSSTNVPTEASPQSDSNDTPQQISVTYLNQTQKINCAPVVVVSSYCNVQPAASPSLSVTSQGSSSPCVTPAPTLSLSSKAPTKSPKAKTIKSTTTHTTKASPIPKPQQKPQEDEHTTQRIFDILAEYAEQLRNSPDLNNKPAPRRRSNPPTNPNQNAKRKKSSGTKKTGQSSNSLASDGDIDDTHTVGSEDSSCGVVQISVQDDEQPLAAVNTSESSEASASPKQLILTDSTPNQSHSLIIADSNVGEALKMSNTAVLVPGNYIMPVSMVKGGQQIAVVSGGSKILATVPARSGPNMLLFQSFLNQTRKHGLPTVKYSTIQPISGITRNISGVTTQTSTNVPATTTQNLTAVTLSSTVGLQKVNQFERVEVNNFDATEVFLAIPQAQDSKTVSEHQQNDHSTITSSITQTRQVDNDASKPESSFDNERKEISNSSVATSVIAQTVVSKEQMSEVQSSTPQTIMALNLNSSESDKDTTIKVEGRVQSVLVATGTSNGPMLSHNPPNYNKQVHSINSISESNKDEYLRNEGKQNNTEPKSLPSGVAYPFQNKIKKTHVSSQRLDRELHQLNLQRKQAALERELRLQKSLSEECEDLGVDEPSASDLFPEADLLFDSNHSPSFDQTSQDLVKRVPVVQETKEETRTIGIFCDDEPMQTDFLFEPIEYRTTSVDLGYERSRDIRNGQSNQSGLSCEDNTLLQTCPTMSDVTIPSPISPEPYTDLSPLTLNKRKYIYTNRKKLERTKQPETWATELSSSEDTTGSTELVNSMSRSPESYSGKRDQNLNCNEELYAIVERLPLKDDQECQEIECEEVTECPSGRGARRSVKKTCSCCNGAVQIARKRPASRPSTPIKKTVTAKKR